MEKNYQRVLEDLENYYGDWFKDEEVLEKGKMTANNYPYNEMFSPITINRLKVKNRLVMAPMGNVQMAEETGRPNEKMIQYFVERAKGGVGLITSGLVPTSFGIDNSLIEKGNLSYFPRIDRSRTVFSGWRDLAAGVHAHGSKFFIQLTPGLGRVGNPQCLVNSLKFPVSASWNPNYYMSDVPCKRLTDGQCKKIIKNTGQAAADAKAANIDGVYLHGHEGYLLEQMTNPAFNRRKIGKYADWQRFGLDMVKEIRRRCGDRYPIMYRIDLSLVLNITYESKMDTEKGLKKFKNERTVEMTLDYMKNLVQAGVDIFDVDLGCYDNWWLPHPPASMPPGCFLDISKIVKDYFKDNNILSNAGVEVPVVAVGKLGYPDLAEQALRDNKCDMVMLGRPLLADPKWPMKAYKGEIDRIIPCIGCQEGCINEFVEGGHPQCAVNPRTAFENIYPETFTKTEKVKKIAVIGSGPAAITFACIAAKRGHDVTIYEKDMQIGGMLNPGSEPSIKYEIKNYIAYLGKLIEDTKEQYKLSIEFGLEMTEESLKDKGFDVIVTATGTKPACPNIPGIDKAHVHQAIDILGKRELAKDATNIVVVGGGVVGCEVAYMLKYEMNKNVKILEMEPYFMNHTCTANRGHIIHYLEKGEVELLNCTALKSIGEKSILVSKNTSNTVPNPYITWKPILPENVENPLAKKIKEENQEVDMECDLVVLAMGGRSNDALYYECVGNNTAKEIYNIGDSFVQHKVLEATRAAYALGISI
ncbi:oxidoreductase [Clostridium sp. DL1XJH146]